MTIRHLDLDPETLGRWPIMRQGAARRFLRAYEGVDARVVNLLRRHAATALRHALALVFIWFGALKIVGSSPVEDLVADTIAWFPSSVIVPAIGSIEVAIGVGLFLGIGLRVVLLAFLGQMLGTFLVLVTQPAESFQDGNPLLLTTIGEFVVKNVVVMAAGLVVGSELRTNEVRVGENYA
jgi:putative oxidoreductase